jgi:hypothetical protein
VRRSPDQLPTPGSLARALLLFWAIWLSVVSASNAVDALQAAGILAPGWRFASGNFALVAESLSIYSLPQIWAAVLFSLVLFLELAASALFWRAALDPNPLSPHAQPKILYPFIVGIGLFCAFLVFDEVLLVYRRFPGLATTHFAVLSALLLSLVLLRVLDGRESSN